MKFKSIFLMAGAAIAGIYLTSEEGKKARQAIQKKKSAVKPIIKDLLKQGNDILEGSKQLNSDELKLNVNKLVNEAKSILINLDLEKTIKTTREAIKIATEKINEASNDISKSKRKVASNKKKTVNKNIVKKIANKK